MLWWEHRCEYGNGKGSQVSICLRDGDHRSNLTADGAEKLLSGTIISNFIIQVTNILITKFQP